MHFALSAAAVAVAFASRALAAPLDEHNAGLMARQSGPSSQFLPSSSALRNSWTLQGCAPDRYPDGRAIMQWYKEVGTIDECLNYCDSVGAKYCGAEYGYQCFGGNALTTGINVPASQLTTTNDGGCSTPARSSSAQRFGGPNALQVYTSNSRSVASSPSPVGGSTFQGCYRDSENARLLPVGYYGRQSNTVESCVSTCTNQGYDLAGLEYRSECHCGDSTKVNIASAQAAASDCQASCTGDNSQLCGGAGRLSIYKRPASAGQPPVDSSKNPTPITVGGSKYVYQGCFKDRSDSQGRALSNYYSVSNNDNVRCVTNCKNAGFKYAATEYGTECRCGNTLRYNVQQGAVCDKACPGDSSQACGGNNYSMSLYMLSS